jgi:hypothetical protein
MRKRPPGNQTLFAQDPVEQEFALGVCEPRPRDGLLLGQFAECGEARKQERRARRRRDECAGEGACRGKRWQDDRDVREIGKRSAMTLYEASRRRGRQIGPWEPQAVDRAHFGRRLRGQEVRRTARRAAEPAE